MRLKSLVSAVLFLVFGLYFVRGIANAATQNSTPKVASPEAQILLIDDKIDATGALITVKEHRIVKVLSPAAVQKFKTLEFTYVAPDEKITLDDVKITSADGKILPVSLTDVKTITPLEKFPAFSNLKAVGLELKDLAPGSTLDYTFTIADQPWISGEYWEEIFLQDMDPIEKEQISLTEKQGREAKISFLNGNPVTPDVSRSVDTVTKTWTLEKLAPYRTEFSMPAAADVAPRLVISTIPNWDKVISSFQTQFLTPTNEAHLNKIFDEAVKGAKTSSDQIKVIYSFVTLGIRSLPQQFGGDIAKIPHPLDYDAIVSQGVGDSRDKAALLAALLKKSGLQPQLALLSTSSNGNVVQSVPVPFAFNRLVVKLDMEGKSIWVDPYSETCPLGYLPPEDQGRTALILDTGKFVETPVYDAASNLRQVNVKGTLFTDGTLKGEIQIVAMGADSLGMRSVLRGMSEQERQQVVASIASQAAQEPQVDSIFLSPVEDLNSPLALGVRFSDKKYATVAGDLTFFSMPVNILNYLKSILTQAGNREYPFVLGNTVAEVKHVELVIPVGYKPRTIPKGMKLDNSVGSYQAGFTVSKNKLFFQSSLKLNSPTVSASDFEKLRSLIANKIKMEESKIVIEKAAAAKE